MYRPGSSRDRSLRALRRRTTRRSACRTARSGTHTRASARPASRLPRPPNPLNDDTRNVGEIYGRDRWTVSPTLALDYGARYARYDYLRQGSLLSPRVGLTLTPYRRHVHHRQRRAAHDRAGRGGVPRARRPSVRGCRPSARSRRSREKTSASSACASSTSASPREFDGAYVLGVRRFQQRVDDQLATLFGLPINGGPKSPGHYFVASAGARRR